MSGRLVILPKKSYCPWKPENVERVRRDERLDRARRERQAEADKERETEARMKALKKEDSGSSDMKHINLFQAEEDAANRGVVHGGVKKENVSGRHQVQLLGATELRSRGKNAPFYLRHRDDRSDKDGTGAHKAHEWNDRKLKTRLDPMKEFDRPPVVSRTGVEKKQEATRKQGEESGNSDCSDHSRRKKRKKKKRRKESSRREKKRRKMSSNTDDVADMRRRRQERELKESKRAATLLGNSTVRYQRYNDQFHPELDRMQRR